MRSCISFIVLVRMFSGCVTSKTETNQPFPDRKTSFICEALCTYKSKRGIGRINLASRGNELELAWNSLQAQCLEVQGISAGKILSQLETPLLVSNAREEYELRPADIQKNCFAVFSD